ncbi:DUF4174 domain-containing protein [Rhizobium sp. Leaf341]|uniref:DUF4174 domain-containing protein n=1 Tax=Rhizobium sp. Leaf341 TaxID=1736344 RepID=UPI0007123860|nr:DUF4174 domain-containing protein [Rhizobium sp. Leaf341]KQR77843.1 hypothetical protein ASG03_15875 [Rhizobium sp. Leaf341]
MSRIPRAAALALLVVSSSFPAFASGIDTFGWKSRVLLVFAKPGAAEAAEQRRLLLQDRAALADRDMVVLEVVDDTVMPVFGKAETATAAELRKDAGVTDNGPFAAILVGKDGGIKLRAAKPVAPEQLFGLIDSMPMRANEASR